MGRGRKVRRAPIGSAIRRSELPAPFHYLYMFLRPRFLNILTLRDVASMFRVLAGLLSAMSIDPLAEGQPLEGMSLADFTEKWSPSLRSLFTGLTRSGLGAHPEDVPISGFIAFLRFYSLMRRDAWAFDYLPGGGGSCVIDPLAGVVRRLGGKIRLGARVMALDRVDNLWQVSVTGEAKPLQAKQLVVALDAPGAWKLLTGSPATKAEAKRLRFPRGIPTAIFRLWFSRRPNPMAEAGIYSGDFVMDNFFWLDQLQPAYRDWAAETGGSALEMHIYGPPALLKQPDTVLLAQVITDTYRAFPELRGHLLHSVIVRNEATHTLFAVGKPDEHLGVETPWPALYACGDWVYHPTPALYLERATTTALAASNALLQSLDLEPFPILPHPEPEWLAGNIERGLRRLRIFLRQRLRAAEKIV